MTTADPTRIPVRTAAPYDVVIGSGVLGEVARLVGDAAQRVAVIHAGPVRELARTLGDRLAAAGQAVETIEVPDAEAAKTAGVAASCWGRLGERGFTRSDAIVGVGGGATTDLAGFVAATWLRGVRIVQVPTTLLGMVDAALGGKTGINLAAGKNLVGAFHEPAGVLCDLDTLASLPEEEYRPGLAEVVKCGFIADPAILDLVESDPVSAAVPGGPVARELVERSVRVKAEVVAGDLTERGSGPDRAGDIGRELLNYGHTLGHALERNEAYRWRHGDAISVGLAYVAELARLARRLDEGTATRHGRVLRSLGLPTTYRPDAWPALLAGMAVDKKARGNRLRFVILDGLAKPAILEGPDPELLRRAYAVIAA